MTGHGRYVLPSIRTDERCISENTVNAALRNMGYEKEAMTAHGFRAMARTILDEVLGERVDLIENQLAHSVIGPNGHAYNRTEHLPACRQMTQRWANYLDQIRLGSLRQRLKNMKTGAGQGHPPTMTSHAEVIRATRPSMAELSFESFWNLLAAAPRQYHLQFGARFTGSGNLMLCRLRGSLPLSRVALRFS